MFVARHWKNLGANVMKIFSWIWIKFFHACTHEWEIIETIKVYGVDRGRTSELPVATKFIQQCKKCGELKSTKL